MMKEQYKIVKNLPDGVLISRKIFKTNQGIDGLSSIISPNHFKTSIKYYNSTFKSLFALKNDFEKEQEFIYTDQK